MIAFSMKENIDSVTKGKTTLKAMLQQQLIPPFSCRERAPSLREDQEMESENWGGGG